MKTPIMLAISEIDRAIEKVKPAIDKEYYAGYVMSATLIKDFLMSLVKEEKNLLIDTFNLAENQGYSIAIMQKNFNVALDESTFQNGENFYNQNFTPESDI
jgi:hypothetical protein